MQKVSLEPCFSGSVERVIRFPYLSQYNVATIFTHNMQFKGGVFIFFFFKKTSQGRVPTQNCSQSAVRGVSTHDAEERERSVHMMDIS